jgi:hypothetical protein
MFKGTTTDVIPVLVAICFGVRFQREEIGPMKKRFSEEQIIGVLREAEAGKTLTRSGGGAAADDDGRVHAARMRLLQYCCKS